MSGVKIAAVVRIGWNRNRKHKKLICNERRIVSGDVNYREFKICRKRKIEEYYLKIRLARFPQKDDVKLKLHLDRHNIPDIFTFALTTMRSGECTRILISFMFSMLWITILGELFFSDQFLIWAWFQLSFSICLSMNWNRLVWFYII